jgi:methyl-accepting chemotaxis protein
MAFHSLRTKILLSLLAGMLLFVAAMVAFTETFIRQKLLNLLQEKGVAIARKIASDAVNPVITERHFEIAMMFKDLEGAEEDVVYAYIVSEDGRDLVSTFPGSVPHALKEAHPVDLLQKSSAREIATDRGPILDIGVPLLRGEIGVLHLGLSLNSIRADVNEFVLLVVLFAVGSLIAGGVAAIGFSRVITRPLRKLARAAESFGRDETNEAVVIESEDEVGELSRVFNAMTENRRHIAEERERLIAELRKTLGEVKTLRGFLPICASCKKIRDDHGYWQQIESYIREHSDAEFSHGLCPDCMQTLYPEIWEKMPKSEA